MNRLLSLLCLVLLVPVPGCGSDASGPVVDAQRATTRYRVLNTETPFWVSVRTTGEPTVPEAGSSALVPVEVRLVREDGADAGVVSTPKPATEGARVWNGSLTAGAARAFLFFHVESSPGTPAPFHGVEVFITPTVGEAGHVEFRIKGQAWACIR